MIQIRQGLFPLQEQQHAHRQHQQGQHDQHALEVLIIALLHVREHQSPEGGVVIGDPLVLPPLVDQGSEEIDDIPALEDTRQAGYHDRRRDQQEVQQGVLLPIRIEEEEEGQEKDALQLDGKGDSQGDKGQHRFFLQNQPVGQEAEARNQGFTLAPEGAVQQHDGKIQRRGIAHRALQAAAADLLHDQPSRRGQDEIEGQQYRLHCHHRGQGQVIGDHHQRLEQDAVVARLGAQSPPAPLFPDIPVPPQEDIHILAVEPDRPVADQDTRQRSAQQHQQRRIFQKPVPEFFLHPKQDFTLLTCFPLSALLLCERQFTSVFLFG